MVLHIVPLIWYSVSLRLQRLIVVGRLCSDPDHITKASLYLSRYPDQVQKTGR